VNVHLHESLGREGNAMLQASMRKHHEGEGGFTLVELLVVIVILGVLAGIVVFAIGSVSNNSNKAACNSDVATIQTASDAYFAANNAYTTVALLVSGTPAYLRSTPTLTIGGTAEVFTVGATGTVTAAPAC
jgi:prepilin-type N-terminal cleavage/methylation domain-containing protein